MTRKRTAITLEEVNVVQADNYARTLLQTTRNRESDDISEDDPFRDESDEECLNRIPSPDDELAALLPRKLSGVISPVRLDHAIKHNTITESDYLLDGINFSDKFYQFKLESISKMEEENEIFFFCNNFNEILSLSHILWLEAETYSDSLIHIFGKDNLKVLSKTLKENFKKSEKLQYDTIAKLYNIFEEHEDDDHNGIDDELFQLEVQLRKNKFVQGLNIIQILRERVASLSTIRMKGEIRENEFRSPEENLSERNARTRNIKRPDFIVSTINCNEFTFTRMIGEVKSGSYDQCSLGVMYDKYKLALFGKDCLDSDTDFVILCQTVGDEVRFYGMTILDEAFYVSIYLKSIRLPLSMRDMKKFVNELNDIFSIRNLVSSICKIETSQKWKRETLQTPLFEDYVPTNVNRRPVKKGKKRQQDEEYANDKIGFKK
ncbi:hypothetical protein MFLAVUS_009284 [Mucor flavus]|uniref:Uncharacterized protein n=1 Tax=Mucor flavus TaxID=439312 RepID=A0ABP9Z9M9_9FUNG